jgi:hypothetical protein
MRTLVNLVFENRENMVSIKTTKCQNFLLCTLMGILLCASLVILPRSELANSDKIIPNVLPQIKDQIIE